MYKVFFKDRVICLHNDIRAVSDMQFDYVGTYGGQKDLRAQLDNFFQADNKKNLFIYHDNLEELYESFQSCFTFIHAAGGIVRNEKGESLFIFRRGQCN